MTTITDQDPAATRELREAAMKFLARGDTGAVMRARAADPRYTGVIAFMSGMTADEAEADMLAIAADVEAVEAEGLTPYDCYLLLGLDKEYASYEAFLKEAWSGR
jgi:hypothetical protein